jgi:AraC family transcriptional regulator, regulatory protein of adaptative response / DNA-3-methyladenine glycosylase II
VIGGLVRARPGLRVPGCVDGDKVALRTVLGQHASPRAALTQTARLVETFGTALEQPLGTVTHLFRAAAALAEADPKALGGLGLRREPLQTLAARLANGEVRIDAGSDPSEALPGYSRFLGSDPGPPRM